MKLTIKYFGLIADITSVNEEVFVVDALLNTEQLLNVLSEKYEGLNRQSFAIAVNKKMTIDNFELNDNDTIALLPPFAGG